MPYEYRLASAADLPQIVAIYNSTIASRQVTADLEPVTVASREAWFAEHQEPLRPLWVVEQDGQLAGWLSFSAFHSRPAYARTAELSIYLDAAFRGQGLGHYLLAEAIRVAPSLQVDTLLGLIFGHNLASLRLFERFGFLRWGHLPRVALLDGVERDLLILGLRVAA